MKNLLTAIALMVLSFTGFAQKMPVDSTTNKITFTEVVPVAGVSQSELYSRAREWFATTFKSADAVLEMEDKENGKLIGKAFQTTGQYTRTWYMVKLYLKDGRYKYEITNISHSYNDGNTNRNAPAEDVYFSKYSYKKTGELRFPWNGLYKSDMEIVDGLKKSIITGLSSPAASKKTDW